MDESDFESTAVTAEVVEPSKELSTVIKEVGLDQQLADEFRINFEEHFKMASTWAKKAKTIIVTDGSQKVLIEEARTARLFLRSKRLEIEKFRVERKEYYLKGGRAIDKVANFLKDTIIPIEEHLDRQEHFVELKKKAEDERILAEARARMEAEEKAEQERLAEEGRKAIAENNRLRQEAIAKEKEQQAELDKIRKENEQKLLAEQLEHNKKLLAERAEREKAEAELRAVAQAKMKQEAEEFKAKQALKLGSDTDKLIKYRAGLKLLIEQFPEIKDKNLIRWAEDCKSHLWIAHSSLNQISEEEV